MRKLDILDIALIIFLILLIIGMFLIYSLYKSEAGECLKDPLGYAQERIGNNSYCSCTQNLEGFKQAIYCSKQCPD